jgi:hypothetical protein
MLFLMTGFATRKQNAIIEYLLVENRVLRVRTGKKRLLLTDIERALLGAKAKLVGRKTLRSITTLFTPDTLLRWHRQLCAASHDHTHKRSVTGRPPLSQEAEDLVLEMAKSNPGWGYDRIMGACKNLGVSIFATSVANILKEHGIEPAPDRKPTATWSSFIKSHMDVLASVDFTTINIWGIGGLKTYYLLFFMEVATRKVHFAGATMHPNDAWMEQVAKHVTDPDNGFLKGKKILLLDRDTKFTASFLSTLKQAGVEPTFTPPKSPNCNAHIERFFLSMKSECLSRLIFFGESTLLVAIAKYVDHYHRHRNHQGVGNLRIEPPPDEPLCGKIICKEEVGGLLNYYHRQAA